jgi:hypothetical protein
MASAAELKLPNSGWAKRRGNPESASDSESNFLLSSTIIWSNLERGKEI